MKIYRKVYGSEKKLYKWLAIIGSCLTLFGLVGLTVSLIFKLGDFYLVFFGAVPLMIGLFTLVPGIAGYYEEKNRGGEVKIGTRSGHVSSFAGIGALFLLTSVPFLSLVLALTAIILGSKAKSEGDDLYASGGLVTGILALIILVFLTILF